MPQSRKRAFTLIELLVVISIIALLVAMLLPALSSARESSRRVECSSKQRQLGLIMAAYTDDYQQYYIPANYSSNVGWAAPFNLETGDGYIWSWGLGLRQKGYMTDNRGYLCPTQMAELEQSIRTQAGELLTIPNAAARYRKVNFGYNSSFIGSSYAVSIQPTPARVFEIKSPGETILMADTEGYYKLTPPPSPSAYSSIYDWHMNGSGANVQWVDGHGTFMAEARDTITHPTSNNEARRLLDRN